MSLELRIKRKFDVDDWLGAPGNVLDQCTVIVLSFSESFKDLSITPRRNPIEMFELYCREIVVVTSVASLHLN
jgi:hypothetical protein